MPNEELMTKFNNILEKYDHNDPNISALIKFLEGYESGNDTYLTVLFLAYIHLINENVELKIKARGYDDLLKIKQNYDKEMADIKAEFDKIEGEESKILLTMDDPQQAETVTQIQ